MVPFVPDSLFMVTGLYLVKTSVMMTYIAQIGFWCQMDFSNYPFDFQVVPI